MYHALGGSLCTHPRVLSYLAEHQGVSVQYYIKKKNDVPVAAIFSINGSLEYKNNNFPFVFDDIILPIKEGNNVILPFKTKRLSPHSQGVVLNSFRQSLFKKKMAHIKIDFSSKSVKKRNGELKRFNKIGGVIADVSFFSPAELTSIYRQLFNLRWQGTVKCIDEEVLNETFTTFRDMIFGKVLFVDDRPCAFDLNYKVECPTWFYFEDFNGGLDPQFKPLGIGSILLWENILQAKKLAASANKKFIFSLGAYNPAWKYKTQWCDINPSGRTIF